MLVAGLNKKLITSIIYCVHLQALLDTQKTQQKETYLQVSVLKNISIRKNFSQQKTSPTLVREV